MPTQYTLMFMVKKSTFKERLRQAGFYTALEIIKVALHYPSKNMVKREFKTKDTKWNLYKGRKEQKDLQDFGFHNPVKSGELRNMGNEEWEKQEGSGMWIPEIEGDELIGEITNIAEGTYGKQYCLKNDDGEILTPSHKVLQNRLIKAKIGDKVKIVYKGEEPPSIKGNNPTKMYEVFIKK